MSSEYNIPTEEMSLPEKISYVRESFREDAAETDDFRRRLAVGGWLGAIAYEWGVGNEVLTPLIGSVALDVAEGNTGVAITGAIMGGFTYVQQRVTGDLSAHLASTYPKGFSRIYETFYSGDDKDYLPFEELPMKKKFPYAFFLGSSFTVTREAVTQDSTTIESRKKVSKKTAMIAAATVASAGVVVDIVDNSLPEGSAAKSIFDTVTNPLIISGGLFTYFGAKFGMNKIRKRKAHLNNDSSDIS